MSLLPQDKTPLFPHFWPIVLVAALALRLYYFAIQGGMHFPDEIFQYLEPAHWRITGTGWLPWEYDRGLRNWLLPGFYGSWIELLRGLGLRSITLQKALWLQTLTLSLLVLPAVASIGRTTLGSQRAGQFVALVVAGFSVLAWLAPHTLSENFGVIFSTWAVAFWFRSTEAGDRGERWARQLGFAFAAGALLGLGCGFRFTLIVLLPIVVLDFNFRSQFLSLVAFLGGLALAIAMIGLVDLATWGRFLHSFVEFIDYNVIEKGNEDHGVMVWHFYLSTALWERIWLALPFSIAFMIPGVRKNWRLILQCAVFIAAHSFIGHKEERFLLSMWPFWVTATAIGIWQLAAWCRERWKRADERIIGFGIAVTVLMVILPAGVGVQNAQMNWREDMFLAQQWVANQAGNTGLLYDGRIHLNGGYFIYDTEVPQTPINRTLISHSLFNYAAVSGHDLDATLRRDGFNEVRSYGEVRIYHR